MITNESKFLIDNNFLFIFVIVPFLNWWNGTTFNTMSHIPTEN